MTLPHSDATISTTPLRDAAATIPDARKCGTALAPVLQRQTFEFSRGVEYFDAAELRTMTGQPTNRFAEVIIKELLDNGLDAAEGAGVAPELCLSMHFKRGFVVLAIGDNAGGIPPETVAKVLNFATRTSDKAAYRSPTRGAQGNALKTVLGIPHALGMQRYPVVIEARGARHAVRCHIDPAGQVRVDPGHRDVATRAGTWVAVAMRTGCIRREVVTHWARAFALFNPHATVRIRETAEAGNQGNACLGKLAKTYRPTQAFPGSFKKFLPSDTTSPWWYDAPALKKLVFAYIAQAEKGGVNLTLRDFVKEFRGLSSTAKLKGVCGQFPGIDRLTDFVGREKDVERLLEVMRSAAKLPSGDIFGRVDEEHFRICFERWFGVKRFWYRRHVGVIDGVPFVLEVALAETKKPGGIFHGVNFSPTFDDPLAGTGIDCKHFEARGVNGFLTAAHVLPGRTVAAFHLICPALEFLDKGKTRLKVPAQIAEAAGHVLWLVSKDLYGEGERRKKDAARQQKADEAREGGKRVQGELKRVAFLVMEEAVKAARGNLSRTSAHTVFYQARPRFQKHTNLVLTPKYFEQKLIPAYQREVRRLPEIYYEPRGTLYEPHSGKAVPLGTREVQEYVFPAWLYDKILFIEKTGLWPVLQAAKLAEHYDMAIVAGEGYATEACRMLFSHASKDCQYQLFVVHDADPFGYNIARTLREETERMPGYSVDVIDLGLRLGDALARGMETETFTRKKAIPQGLELNELERQHFVGEVATRDKHGQPKSWLCRRVELNAFSSPELIAYIEEGLEANGVRGKVIPPAEVLQKRLRWAVSEHIKARVREAWQERLDAQVREAEAALEKALGEASQQLADEVKMHLEEEPTHAWPDGVETLAVEFTSESDSREIIDAVVKKAMQGEAA